VTDTHGNNYNVVDDDGDDAVAADDVHDTDDAAVDE